VLRSTAPHDTRSNSHAETSLDVLRDAREAAWALASRTSLVFSDDASNAAFSSRTTDTGDVQQHTPFLASVALGNAMKPNPAFTRRGRMEAQKLQPIHQGKQSK
jgi:hypothetical protein